MNKYIGLFGFIFFYKKKMVNFFIMLMLFFVIVKKGRMLNFLNWVKFKNEFNVKMVIKVIN